MDRLLWESDVIKAFDRVLDMDFPYVSEETPRDRIESVPSAQPGIIRCKDCEHSFLHNNGERTSRICGLTRMCGTTPDDWYCGDAKRRTDND